MQKKLDTSDRTHTDDSKKTSEKKKKRKELSAFFRMVASLKQDNDFQTADNQQNNEIGANITENNQLSGFNMECDTISQDAGYSFDTSNLFTDIKTEPDALPESYGDQSLTSPKPEKKRRSRSSKAKAKKTKKDNDVKVESGFTDAGEIQEKKSRPPVINLFCDDCDMVSQVLCACLATALGNTCFPKAFGKQPKAFGKQLPNVGKVSAKKITHGKSGMAKIVA